MGGGFFEVEEVRDQRDDGITGSVETIQVLRGDGPEKKFKKRCGMPNVTCDECDE